MKHTVVISALGIAMAACASEEDDAGMPVGANAGGTTNDPTETGASGAGSGAAGKPGPAASGAGASPATGAGAAGPTPSGGGGVGNVEPPVGAGATPGGTGGSAMVTSGGSANNPPETGGNPAASGAVGMESGGGTGGAGGAGMGGMGATPDAAGAPSTASAGEGDLLFAEDFELDTPGSPASEWDYFISYVVNMANPSGGVQALVETGTVHGGSQAMHIIGGQSPAMITRPLPTGTNRLYVRAYIHLNRTLGANPDTSANHETMIGIRGEPGGANREVRFGEIKGTLGTNEVPSDNIIPTMDQWYAGTQIPGDEWVCWEVAFLADQAQHELYAWANDELVHSVTADTPWQNGEMPPNWLDGMFAELILGWHSFSGSDAELWIDDIEVRTGRVGCLP